MHFQHHAKPNCFRKDPDINMHPFFFALGKILSVEVSRGINGKVLENGNAPAQKALGDMLTMVSVWERHGGPAAPPFGSRGGREAVNGLSRTPVLPN